MANQPKQPSGQPALQPTRTRNFESSLVRNAPTSAQARTVLLLFVCFIVGLGVGAYWYYRASHPNPATAGEPASSLSEATRLVLKELGSPVEIRFYSLLDPATTSEAVQDFARRTSQMLSAYEQEADGKIKVNRESTRSDAATVAATADGLKVFNLEKGEPCFLGLALICKDQKETLAQLSPDWEAALESDLSRALVRVVTPKPVARTPRVASPTQLDTNAIAEVKSAIPDLESVSLADATQTLRVAALKEFTAATEAMDRAVKKAEQRIIQAQAGASEAEKQAAVKNLQQLQAEHTAKLQQIAARLQSQIDALKQIKGK